MSVGFTHVTTSPALLTAVAKSHFTGQSRSAASSPPITRAPSLRKPSWLASGRLGAADAVRAAASASSPCCAPLVDGSTATSASTITAAATDSFSTRRLIPPIMAAPCHSDHEDHVAERQGFSCPRLLLGLATEKG